MRASDALFALYGFPERDVRSAAWVANIAERLLPDLRVEGSLARIHYAERHRMTRVLEMASLETGLNHRPIAAYYRCRSGTSVKRGSDRAKRFRGFGI